MGVTTAAGTCLAVCASVPAANAFTLVGFEALTWSQVGEMESMGDLKFEHNKATWTPICTGISQELKGSRNPVGSEIVCAVDRKAGGQIILNNAADALGAAANIAIRITWPDGYIDYAIVTVMSRPIGGDANDANTVRKGTWMVSVQPSLLGTLLVTKVPA